MRPLPRLTDPMVVLQTFWPQDVLYDKQEEITYSIKENDETYVPAGNMLGKDWIAGRICVGAFLFPEAFLQPSWAPRPRLSTVRIVTTSVKDDHLRVLWGEIGMAIQTCRFELDSRKGGPLVLNHRDIGKMVGGKKCPISYLRGMVSERGEGMAGHHAAYTLLLGDEASGLDDLVYTQGTTWAKKVFMIGNPNHGCANFFYRAVKAGDEAPK